METTGRFTTLGLLIAGAVLSVSAAGAQEPATQEHEQHGTEHRHMQHRFEDAERYAKVFDDPARDEWQMPERVIEALAIQEGDVVADIGAGTGYFTVRIAAETGAKTVYAVDIEPSMVDHVRQRAKEADLENVIGVVAEAATPNLPEPVDLVLIVDTYHHLPDRVDYFTALRERLKPGARLAIVDFKKGAPGGGPPDHFRFTVDEISDELGRAGFELAGEHDFLPRQNFLIYVMK